MDRLDRIEKILEEETIKLKEVQESQKKTDEQIKELRKSQKETDEQIKRTDINVGRLTGSWGKFTQGISVPSIIESLKKEGFVFKEIFENPKAIENGIVKVEIDLLGIASFNGKEVVVVGETKTNLTPKDVEDFVKDIMMKLDLYFPIFKEKNRIGIVSGIKVGTGVDKYAEKQGLYIFSPSGEVLKRLNTERFQPKMY